MFSTNSFLFETRVVLEVSARQHFFCSGTSTIMLDTSASAAALKAFLSASIKECLCEILPEQTEGMLVADSDAVSLILLLASHALCATGRQRQLGPVALFGFGKKKKGWDHGNEDDESRDNGNERLRWQTAITQDYGMGSTDEERAEAARIRRAAVSPSDCLYTAVCIRGCGSPSRRIRYWECSPRRGRRREDLSGC